MSSALSSFGFEGKPFPLNHPRHLGGVAVLRRVGCRILLMMMVLKLSDQEKELVVSMSSRAVSVSLGKLDCVGSIWINRRCSGVDWMFEINY